MGQGRKRMAEEEDSLETMILVARPKKRKVKCAALPHLTRMISRYVWQLGAFCLSLLAIMANSKTAC